ncbi:E3 ubiquitin-protein ligase RNF8-like isoform X2 [Belonocnema kinseyi]|uniref:E3 ubiquitin-protein ligase RNF8-like isoform X2 n=1 Tax=Belonocnema kinseyi TaxID=2817044 RepID=UPI00143CE8D3|nr:E3 ubiquitin-protein ligase RNF8-like isoform X2 [Belonocnema kinseyi]
MDGQRAEKRELSQELEPVLVRVMKKSKITQDIHITKNEFKLGRSLENDFVIKDICISRQHCIFRLTEDDQWSITHCSSVNPILINDNPIYKGATNILQVGDVVQLNPEEEFKYVFTLNIKSDQAVKKPRLEGRLFDDVLNEQKSFVAAQETKRKDLEDQLQEKQKEQIELQLELDRLRKEKEISQELGKQIATLEQKIELGNVLEKELHNKYRELLDKLEEEKRKFEERLAEEKRKWQEALEASKQEKVTLEISMKEQMEEWKLKQQEEWKSKMDSLVLEEKNMQDKLLNEKTLLEQKLKEMEDTLREKENAIQRIPSANIIETTVDLLENAIVVEIPHSSSLGTLNIPSTATNSDILDTIDLTLDSPRSSSIEQANKVIFGKVENIMEEQLTCSICSELFVRAMTTNCMHTFCNHCIMTWMKKSKEPVCPVCRSRVISMTRSLVIDNFIERMVENLPPASRHRRTKLVKERKDFHFSVKFSGRDVS